MNKNCTNLGRLLHQPGLLLVLKAVVLHVLPQAAGVRVALMAAVDVAFVGFLKNIEVDTLI